MPPTPVVVRRFKDKDRIARTAGEIVERALAYMIDKTGFDAAMRDVRQDYLLAGRGTAWIRYEADFEALQNTAEGQTEAGNETDATEPAEQITDERVIVDYVSWQDFGHSPARRWEEVDAVWRRVFMSRDKLKARFGDELGSKIPLDHSARAEKNLTMSGMAQASGAEKATIYEIWDKDEQEVIWISKSYPEILDRQPPPINLEGFFPCPKPFYATTATDSLIPVPDYIFYQDQAEQIDVLTARNDKLSDMLKLVGFYPAGSPESKSLQEAVKIGTENTLIPIPSWTSFQEKGGVGQIQWLPVDNVARVITECQQMRQALINDIYQITGISDIVRGASNPNETATAQNIKNQWGAVRVRDRQTEMQRFARDCLRIMGEVIAEKFQPATLMKITGMQLPTDMDLMQYFQQQQMAAQAQGQQFQPPDPDTIPITVDQVIQLLHDDLMRSYRIDVETDSTIAADENQDKQSWNEMLQAVAMFMQQAMPVGAQLPPLVPALGEMLQTTIRKYRAGKQLEDSLDQAIDEITAESKQQQQQQKMMQEQQAGQPPQPPPPTPEMMKAQSDMQVDQAKLQNDIQISQAKQQLAQQIAMEELQLKQAQVAAEQRRQDIEAQQDAANLEREVAFRQTLADLEARHSDRVTAMTSQLAEQNRAIMEMLSGLAQAHQQSTGTLAAAMTAPKRIVRDPSTGAIIGAETIQ
jgi:hypothetical protein